MSGGTWLRIGAIAGALAVAIGAFGAHSLKGLSARSLEVFETGARYQMYHALALLAVGLVASQGRANGSALAVAGWSFLVGIVLFSGSLYALALTNISKLGAITPIGGLAFLVGWSALAIAVGGPGE